MNRPAAVPVTSPAVLLHGLVDALQLSGVLSASAGGAGGAAGEAADAVADGAIGEAACGEAAAAPCGLADDALLAGVVEVERLGRIVDGLRVWVAGEVAARSAAEYGDDGLARSQNFGSVPGFLAAVTGTRVSSAKNLVRLASRVHSTVSLAGLPNPPLFPAVAAALSAGVIGVDAASAITGRLHDVASRTGFTADLAAAETTLVGIAAQCVGGLGYTADEVDAVAVRLREHLDPDGAEPREAVLHEARTLTVHTLPSGMTRLSALLPPSMAAVVCSALEPFTSPRIVTFTDTAAAAAAGRGDRPATSGPGPDERPSAPDPGDRRAASGPGAVGCVAALGAAAFPGPAPEAAGGVPVDAVFADTRTVAQKRVDALVHLVTLAAGLPSMPRLNGAAPTVNVHATLTDIVAGRGVGWVDGLSTPIPASTIDTLLCHADIITTVFGEHGQILQHGKTRRLFTPAQNRALAARDGGCVWPGCDAPPSRCETHHIQGWQSPDHTAGRTDVDNGALLCHFHHTNAQIPLETHHPPRCPTPHPTPVHRLDTNTPTLPTPPHPTTPTTQAPHRLKRREPFEPCGAPYDTVPCRAVPCRAVPCRAVQRRVASVPCSAEPQFRPEARPSSRPPTDGASALSRAPGIPFSPSSPYLADIPKDAAGAATLVGSATPARR